MKRSWIVDFRLWAKDVSIRLGPPLSRLATKFKSLSLLAKTGIVSLGAAFLVGLVGAVGEDTWQWLTAGKPTQAATPVSLPPELSSDQKKALFAKEYPTVRYDTKEFGGDDENFRRFKRNLKIIDGAWQASSPMLIGRRFVPTKFEFSSENVLSAHLVMPNCDAVFTIVRAKEGDSVTLKRAAASGGWCARTAAILLESIVDDSMSMNIYMADGSTEGPTILIRSFQN